MESVYAALILHKAEKEISQAGIEKILKAAGVTVNSDQVKALVKALEKIDIEDVIKGAAAAPVVAAPAAAAAGAESAKAEEKKEEKKKEEKKKEEPSGLGALFG
ncbi:MAG: 50S ribosomal protein P1 [Promethearchaeota archaeon]